MSSYSVLFLGSSFFVSFLLNLLFLQLLILNCSALCRYLDLAIIGEVTQGGHDLGHCCSQSLLHGLLLPLGDSGEAWQQVDQVGSGQQEMEGGRRMQTEQSSNKHFKNIN